MSTKEKTESNKLVHFTLTEYQGKKLAHAHQNGQSVTLRLSKDKLSAGGIPLELTQTEYKLIMSKPGAHNIVISASRVKTGGFLPALLAAIPAIASILAGGAAATTIASNIKSMVTGHGRGLYLNKK